MRLQGRMAMGYYPTPPHLVGPIRSYCALPDVEYAALDPFAGEGAALAEFVQSTPARTYGVELDEARADKARRRLHRVARGDMMAARISQGSFSLLYFNPPYDWQAAAADDRPEERKEVVYLRRCHRYLRSGGILVALVPHQRLENMARVLSTHFRALRWVRFPDGDYARYAQVVVFGVKRDRPVRDTAAEKALREIARSDASALPALAEQAKPMYRIPPSNPDVPLFTSGVFLAQEAAEIERTSSLWKEAGRWLIPPMVDLNESPPLPFHMRHQAQLLATGALDGVMGTGEDRHLVKGQVIKVTDTRVEEEEDAEGRITEVSKEVESFEIRVRAVHAQGDHVHLS